MTIELKVYKYNDPDNYLGSLPVRLAPKFLEQLKANGSGTFKIPLTRAVIYPEILEYRNIVKVVVDDFVVGAFIIGQKNSTMISESEYAGEALEVIGEGLKVLADDAAVEPYGGLKATSGDSRAFNFSSEVGSWYDPVDWIVPVNQGAVFASTLPAWGTKRPEDFPADTGAQWIWVAPYSAVAQLGTCYFRLSFTTATANSYALYASGDDFMTVWLNGEQIAVQTDGWGKATKIKFNLPEGDHVLAFTVANDTNPITGVGGRGPAALAVALMTIGADDKETTFAKSGTGNWRVMVTPPTPPGWTAGEILLTLLNEAAARGVLFANWFTPSFTATQDSNGDAWPTTIDFKVDIGESYASVISKLEEMIGDIWFDPSTMEIHAVPQRGTDRTVVTYLPDGVTPSLSPIKFEKGRNLLAASSQGVGKVKNSLKIRTERGWLIENNEYDPSTLKYGKLEGKLETNTSDEFAENLAQVVFAQKGMPEEGASYKIIITDGKVPWRDYGPGDWVLAPNDLGFMVPRRIVSISAEESETGEELYTLEFDTVFKTNEQKLAQFMNKSSGGGGVSSSLSNGSTTPPPGSGPTITPPSPAPLLYPKIPTSVIIDSVGSWSANGVYPESTVTLNWTDVTENTDDSPTVPIYYEVWGYPSATNKKADTLLATTLTSDAEIPGLTPGEEWKFRVRAHNSQLAVGEFTAEVVHTPVGPITPMDPPTTPVLDSQAGLLIVNWDGKLNDEGVSIDPPPQFRYAYIEVATAAAGPFTQKGNAFFRDDRSASIPGLLVGTQYWARLLAIDGVGLASAPSASATITITGIDLGELDPAIDAAITAAQNAADAAQGVADDAYILAGQAADDADDALIAVAGKSKIVWSTAVPTNPATGYTVGDLWYRRSGSEIIGVWEVVGSTWTSRTITDAAITNLNAGKITAGFLAAARIATKSLSADKLVISDFTDLVDNGGFENDFVGWTQGGSPQVVADAFSGAKAAKFDGNDSVVQIRGVSVTSGQKLLVKIRYKTTGYVGGENGGVRLQNESGTEGVTWSQINNLTPSEGVWTEASLIATVTASSTTLYPRLAFALTAGKSIIIDGYSIRRMNNGELIVDGAITAGKIGAAEIIAGKLAAGAVATENLQAQSVDAEAIRARSISVTHIAVGGIEAENISAGAIQTNHLSPLVGEELDISANDTVNIIAGQVGAVEADINNLGTNVEEMQTYYSFGATGAVISTPGSPFAVALRNDRIEMLENGNVVSYWNSGQMHVSQLVGEKVILGNHQLEKYGDGTVVRAL